MLLIASEQNPLMMRPYQIDAVLRIVEYTDGSDERIARLIASGARIAPSSRLNAQVRSTLRRLHAPTT